MTRDHGFRHRCETEKAVLAQQVVDLEVGLAEQARLLSEVRQAARALEERMLSLELSLANVGQWLKQQHEETTYERLCGLVRRVARRGV